MKTVALEDVLTSEGLRNGLSPSAIGEVEGGVLTLSAVTGDSFDPGASRRAMFSRAIPEAQQVRAGLVMFSRGNGNPDLVGRAVLADRDMPGVAFPDTVIAGTVDEARYLPQVLVHLWKSIEVRLQIRAISRTTNGTYKVNQQGLAKVRIPLPSLDEQRRIATILDHADTLRAKRRQVLAHRDTLTQSIFHDMFGEVATSATVEDVATQIRTGPFGSQLLHSEFVAEGIAVLGLDNVVGNEFRWAERRYISPAKYEQLKRYTVRPGDVLISIMGTTGRCVVVPGDIPTAINTKHICAITPDRERLDPTFLRAAFLWHPEAREHLRRQTKGSIMDGLNMGIIKAMPVPVPPHELQRRFARRVEAVEAERGTVLAAQAAEDELFTSLQSRAFRGGL